MIVEKYEKYVQNLNAEECIKKIEQCPNYNIRVEIHNNNFSILDNNLIKSIVRYPKPILKGTINNSKSGAYICGIFIINTFSLYLNKVSLIFMFFLGSLSMISSIINLCLNNRNFSFDFIVGFIMNLFLITTSVLFNRYLKKLINNDIRTIKGYIDMVFN